MQNAARKYFEYLCILVYYISQWSSISYCIPRHIFLLPTLFWFSFGYNDYCMLQQSRNSTDSALECKIICYQLCKLILNHCVFYLNVCAKLLLMYFLTWTFIRIANVSHLGNWISNASSSILFSKQLCSCFYLVSTATTSTAEWNTPCGPLAIYYSTALYNKYWWTY